MIGPAEQVFLSNELHDMKHSGESLNTDGSRSYDFVQGLHLKMLYHRARLAARSLSVLLRCAQ
ncbi:hypothetical protein [Paraburkholderia elongata]|uniref:Uncharacterized protein n=1 Tax=Paraburkholderia elongata TaxID=2675747 RepID=A0A972NPL4_9BURK|nr:hypothetical protein [Paraburkholderia elongata]NPT56108.1 hypothetical protein [Paraburkholderia elongata]